MTTVPRISRSQETKDKVAEVIDTSEWFLYYLSDLQAGGVFREKEEG